MITTRLLGICFALALGVGHAAASVITFGTATPDTYFTGSITENGFTYSNLAGQLYVQTRGTPGPSIGGPFIEQIQPNILGITRDDGGLFTFSRLDYAAFDQFTSVFGPNVQTLTIEGYRNGILAASDSYNLLSTGVFNPDFDNWTTEFSSNLAGISIDALRIPLFGIATPGDTIIQFVDNVVLLPVIANVPEPASLTVLGAALAGIAAIRRRRKV